jgi:hypothetical protein
MRGSAEINVVVLVRGKVFKYMSYGFATLRDLGSAADPSSS